MTLNYIIYTKLHFYYFNSIFYLMLLVIISIHLILQLFMVCVLHKSFIMFDTTDVSFSFCLIILFLMMQLLFLNFF